MTVRDDVREFLRTTLLVDAVGDDDSFLATGLVDSLGIAQLMAYVEAELGVVVGGEDLVPANFDSLARIDAFVQRKRAS